MRRLNAERDVIWVAWEGPGLEHLRLVSHEEGVVANGLVIGLEGGRPFRISYEIRCDRRWRVREVRAVASDSERPVFDLLAGGEGRWKRRGREPVPELNGCIDVESRRHPSPTPSLSAGSGLSPVNPKS